MAARWLLCGLCLIPGWLLAACTAISSASVYPGDGTVEAATAASPDNTGFTPRFDRYLPFFRQEGESSKLVGLVQQGNNWHMASVPYPADADPGNSDYARTTDRLLVWRSVNGAGPGNLSAGPLSIIDLAAQTQQIIVPDDVVSAGWAPNGVDFAYILATPDSYELYWRSASGEDRLLAADVPHSLRISPDGRFVAFTRESHYGLTAAVPGLYVVDIETGKETQVSTLDRAGYGGLDLFWKPSWSPDSSQLLLYAVADSDRAAITHESGYVWAAADGSFSHFLPDSDFLDYFDEPLSRPENVPCLGGPLFFFTNHLIFLIGQCQPMSMGPQTAAIMDFALDAQAGTITARRTLSEPVEVELLAWDVPGESLLLLQEGEVVTLRIDNEPVHDYTD